MSPFAKQIFAVSAPVLAALSVGTTASYPATLLHQLKGSDPATHFDLERSSWLASVYGISGIFSVVMPTLMQIKGRKISLILSCILVLIGWIIIYLASDFTGIIIGECFHGLGSHMFHVVGLVAISEMVTPSIRKITMPLMNINLMLGSSVGQIIGNYVDCKTLCIIFSVPLILALAVACFCPDSPMWLAYKNNFEECKRAFEWLRGTDKESQKELAIILNTQAQATKNRDNCSTMTNKNIWKIFIANVSRRDFYLPCLHVTGLIAACYCSGLAVIIIYSKDLVEKATNNNIAASYTFLTFYILLSISAVCSCFTPKYFKNKTILLFNSAGSTICLLAGGIITFCQKLGVLSENSMLFPCCLIVFIVFGVSWLILTYSISAEIIPVKHRDVGGIIFIAMTCILHAVTVKIAPYMLEFCDLWGTFLIFSLSPFLGFFLIWKCVPETKGKTLREIENFYNHKSYSEEATLEELRSMNRQI